MPRSRLRSRLVALGAVALLLALGACGTAAPPSGATAALGLELTTLRVGVLPIVDTAAVQRAQSAGYFAAEGLDVRLQPVLGGASAVPQLIAGELDLSWSSWTTVVLSQQQGAGRFRILDAGYTAAPKSFQLLTRPGPTISRPQDLVGKVVAVNTLNSITDLMGRSALRDSGIDPKQVHFVEWPFPNMLEALRTREIDGAVLPEPYLTQAVAQLGAVSVLDAASGRAADLPIAGLAATTEFANRNPHTLAAFERALDRAQADMADRGVVDATLAGYAKIDLSTAARLDLGSWPAHIDPAGLQRLADLMQEFVMTSSRFDVAPLLDPTG
jgi:NitT/TauT family transport system substrate-binding protein